MTKLSILLFSTLLMSSHGKVITSSTMWCAFWMNVNMLHIMMGKTKHSTCNENVKVYPTLYRLQQTYNTSNRNMMEMENNNENYFLSKFYRKCLSIEVTFVK